MTGFGIQPDSYFPTSVTNAAPGFSAYSQKTQEDYQTEQTDQMLGVLAPLTGLCSTLTSNPYFAEILAIGQDVSGATGNMLVDFLNGATPYANDLLAFLGDPVGVGTGIVTGVINAAHIGALDASKIVSGTFANSFVPGLQSTWNSIVYALGGSALGNDLTDVITALQNIPADNIIGAIAGGAQEVIDAILSAANDLYTAGSGTATDVENVFNNLFAMFADPALTDTAMSVTGAVETFVADMLAPTNLLAPLVAVGANYVVPAINIAVLDAAKITSGTFADSFVPGIAALQNTIITSQGGASGGGLAGVTAALENIVINNVNGLTGYLTHLSSSGVLALIGLAAGALPAGITLGAAALTAGAIGAGVTMAGSALTSAIAAVNVPALTSAWAGTIDGAVLRNAITTATLAGSQLSSAITNQNYIPALTSAWPHTVDASLLAGAIATTVAPWAAPIDTLMNAWGVAATGNTAAELAALAASIPHVNVQGNLGAESLGQTVQDHVDQIVQSVNNNYTTVNNSLSNLGTALSNAFYSFIGYNPAGATPAGSMAANLGTTSSNLINRAVQKPPYANIDPTTDGTFEIRDIWQNATLPVIALTQGHAAMADITIRDGGIKQAVTWYGYPTGGTMANLPDFRINLYSVDKTTNIRTLLYTSANYSASVATGSTPQFNSFNLPALNYINSNQGDKISAEIAIPSGTGTYNIVGQTLSSQMPLHPVYGIHGLSRVASTPTFDALGAGYTKNTSGSTVSGSWLHNATAGAAVVVAVGVNGPSGTPPASFTRTATYDPTGVNRAMTSLGVLSTSDTGTGNYGWLEFFGITGAPGGSKTVAISVTGGSPTFYSVEAQSFSYNNVSGFGTVVNGQHTASASLSSGAITTSSPQGMIFQAFYTVMNPGAVTQSTYNQTSRWNQALLNSSASWGSSMVAGDAVGAASVTFTATASTSANANAGLAVPMLGQLQPPPPTLAAPTSLSSTPLAYSMSVPWLGLSGVAAATIYQPQTMTIITSGSVTNPTTTYPWANYFDVLCCGGGAGGDAGGPLQGSLGGAAGAWGAATLTKAQMGSSSLTAAVGVGGVGGGTTSAGGNPGGNTTVTVSGYGTVTGTGAAGRGSAAASGDNRFRPGVSAANEVWTDHYGNQQTYNGGAGGGAAQSDGQIPGGGGGGGNAVNTYGTYVIGGNGGPGIIYIRAYQ